MFFESGLFREVFRIWKSLRFQKESVAIVREKHKWNILSDAIRHRVLVIGMKPELAQGFSKRITKLVPPVNQFPMHYFAVGSKSSAQAIRGFPECWLNTRQ
jgi:hypothetical protein